METPGAPRVERRGRQRAWGYQGRLPGGGEPCAGKDEMGEGEEHAQ